MQDVLDVVNYTTGYTTKHESAKGESLYDRLANTSVPMKDMLEGKCCLKEKESRQAPCVDLLNQREVGTMEMCDMIVGHPLHFFDVGHVFINTNDSDKRSRMVKEASKFEDMDNWLDTYYPRRDATLDDAPLFNLMIHFELVGLNDSSVVFYSNPKKDHYKDLRHRTPSGMLKHFLELQEGAMVMLLRNLDVKGGLCNGTKLIVVKMMNTGVLCKFVNPPPNA
ncbi:hypothetical protein QR680_007397 [Steinernema hermaphroditum]|uniref:DNA helicase Pif1-like 2B domain-containing protein n=1 Tax=Steinernema hermaphroditum TaxID=289476 RepID=A0AA39ID19_9BILA|nr:hypothetical protein QR680_007397 [Steinernema hermaphroditum]